MRRLIWIKDECVIWWTIFKQMFKYYTIKDKLCKPSCAALRIGMHWLSYKISWMCQCKILKYWVLQVIYYLIEDHMSLPSAIISSYYSTYITIVKSHTNGIWLVIYHTHAWYNMTTGSLLYMILITCKWIQRHNYYLQSTILIIFCELEIESEWLGLWSKEFWA